MDAKFELRMQPRISPQLVMAGKLLQLSGVEMEQVILEELVQNPALELIRFADPMPLGASPWAERWSHQHRAGSEDTYAIENIPTQQHAIDRLIADAMLLVTRADQPLAIYLLHSLDGHGYLRWPMTKLAADSGAPLADIERVIHLLQQLEPPGIAARDLRECLTIQCAHLAATGVDSGLAHRMLTECWDEFVHQRWERSGQKLGVPRAEIDQVRISMSRYLYPYPLLLLESPAPEAVAYPYADLVIRPDASGAGYQLHLPGAEAFALQISPSLDGENGRQMAASEQAWVNKHVARARMFMAAVEQRWLTLRRIGNYLVSRQQAFLEHGVAHLQPLTRADVAAALSLHESTVSRATRDKVVELPSGRRMQLSDLFDGSLVAKEAIRRLLGCSRRPLSDREIASQLEMDGLALARRTVTKYRQQLNMPSTHARHVAALDNSKFAYPVMPWRSAL